MPVDARASSLDGKCSAKGNHFLDNDSPGGDDDGSPNGDHSDEYNERRWTFDHPTAAILHTTGCCVCDELRIHHDSDRLLYNHHLNGAHLERNGHFKDALRIEALTREREFYDQEARALGQELEEVERELEEVQQDQARITLAERQDRL
jgi:hypothetical protein